MNDLSSRHTAEYEADLSKRLLQQQSAHASDCAIWVLEECDCIVGRPDMAAERKSE